MVTYYLYAHILRSTMPCSDAKILFLDSLVKKAASDSY